MSLLNVINGNRLCIALTMGKLYAHGDKDDNNNNKSELSYSQQHKQQLEDITDNIRQRFIHAYKACYNENNNINWWLKSK
jgi:hypothetical protein